MAVESPRVNTSFAKSLKNLCAFFFSIEPIPAKALLVNAVALYSLNTFVAFALW